MDKLSKAAVGEFNFGGEGEVNATFAGMTTKALLLMVITFVIGALCMNFSLYKIYTGDISVVKYLMYGSLILSLIVALITIFKPESSPITAPLYAVVEGGALGVVSAFFEVRYPGIVATAVMSTFSVFIVMLLLWKFRLIVPTARFRAIIVGATAGIAVLYLLNLIFTLVGFPLLPRTGALSIGVSLVVCTIAAFNLILDFDDMERAVATGLPKHVEYYCAFSLLLTLCWLYIEILNLLSKRE